MNVSKATTTLLNSIKQLTSQKRYIEAKQLISNQLKQAGGGHSSKDRSELYFQLARVNNKMGFKQYVYDNYLRCLESNHPRQTFHPNEITLDHDDDEGTSNNDDSISIYLLMIDVFLYQFKSAYWANQVFSDMYKYTLLDEHGEMTEHGQQLLTKHGKRLSQLKRSIDIELSKLNESGDNFDGNDGRPYDALMYYPRVTSEYDTSVRHNAEFFRTIGQKFGSIEVKQISNENRGVFATKSIAKGEVLIDEEPFVQVGLSENACIRCGKEVKEGNTKSDYCRNRTMNNERLCGETLMDFCEYFASTTTELPKLALLFARLIGMQLERSDDGKVQDLYEAHPFLGLLIPSKVFEAQIEDKAKHVPMDLLPIQNLYNAFAERLEFTDDDYDQIPLEVFERFVLTLVNYNYSYNQGENFFVGNTLSFINHSCKPNANRSITKDGQRILVTALRDIKKGEEISIAYFDPISATPETSFMYGFACKIDCNCPSKPQ